MKLSEKCTGVCLKGRRQRFHQCSRFPAWTSSPGHSD